MYAYTVYICMLGCMHEYVYVHVYVLVYYVCLVPWYSVEDLFVWFEQATGDPDPIRIRVH